MKTLKAIMSTVKNTMKRITARIVTGKKLTTMKLAEERGDFAFDHGAVAIIIVVVAGIVIALLVAFLQSDFAPALGEKILGLFSLS